VGANVRVSWLVRSRWSGQKLVYFRAKGAGVVRSNTWQSTSNMITTSTKTAPITLQAVHNEKAMRVDGTDTNFGDWRDDLARDGYAVVKGAIPRERADKYAEEMFEWLEGLYVTCILLQTRTDCCKVILASTAMTFLRSTRIIFQP
jgi:hypothetical protein